MKLAKSIISQKKSAVIRQKEPIHHESVFLCLKNTAIRSQIQDQKTLPIIRIKRPFYLLKNRSLEYVRA